MRKQHFDCVSTSAGRAASEAGRNECMITIKLSDGTPIHVLDHRRLMVFGGHEGLRLVFFQVEVHRVCQIFHSKSLTLALHPAGAECIPT